MVRDMGSPLPPDLSSQLGVRLFELHLDRRRSIQQERKRHRVGRKSRKQTAGKETAAIYQKRWCGAATSTRGRRGRGREAWWVQRHGAPYRKGGAQASDQH